MTPPKTVAVVGFKDSGKTRVVEALVGELTHKGYRVGTVKHTAENIGFDTPGKDTSRHRAAGAVASAILHDNTAALFLDTHIAISDAVRCLGPIDFLIIEGFKTLDTHARILVPRGDGDVDKLRNGLELAAVKMPGSAFNSGGHIEVVELSDVAKLARLVESKAYAMLPGVDCQGCGYSDCRSLGKAILSGDADATMCARNLTAFMLKVNGESTPLNNFTRRILTNVLTSIIKTLKGAESIDRVELAFQTPHDG